MPAELKPNFKRKLTTKGVKSKVGKVVNIEETLKTLEQKEKTKKTEDGETQNKDEEKESDNVREFLLNFCAVPPFSL